MENLPQIPANDPNWGVIALVVIALTIAFVTGLVMIAQNFFSATKTAKELTSTPDEPSPLSSSTPQIRGEPKQAVELSPLDTPRVDNADTASRTRSSSKQHESDASIWGKSTTRNSSFEMPTNPSQVDGENPGEADWIELEERLTHLHPGEFRATSYE